MNKKKLWKRFFSLNRHHAEGFTLVELIVVIAILAILGGVAVPAYSGYIAKAEQAADDALLAEVNMAFASACAMEGERHTERKDTSATITDGVFGLQSKDAIVTAFNNFYEDGVFKTYEWLDYNSVTGTFTGGQINEVYKKLLDSGIFSETDLEALKDSPYYEMGLGVLLDMVGEVGDVAADMWDSNSNMGKLMGSVSNEMKNLYGQEAQAKLKEMRLEKMKQLIAENPEKYAGMDAEAIVNASTLDPNSPEKALRDAADNQIKSNIAVIKVAQQSQAASEKMQDVLNNSNGKTVKENLIANIQSGDNSAIAQVAMSYGLYVAYAERNGMTVPSDYNDVLAGMDDPGFQNYLSTNNAKEDLNAFQSSMNLVNSSTTDKDALTNVLTNGFDDPGLAAILNQAIANTGK